MRLLFIEDNQRLADYLGTALQNGGFAIDHVTTTVDAEGALTATHYDTILLDLGLPDMDGLVWLGQQRRQQMTRPVLVLTARDSLEDLVAGLNQGADDYLRKPFELDELIARVRALLRRPGEALRRQAHRRQRDAQHQRAGSERRRTAGGVRASRSRRTGALDAEGGPGRCPNPPSKMRFILLERILPPMPSKCSSIEFADACRRRGQTCIFTHCVAWAMCSLPRPQANSSQSPTASLWLRLIVGLVGVSLLAVGTASAVLYVRFKAKNTQFHEQTLRNQAALISDFVKKIAPAPIELSSNVTEEFRANSGRYAVVDRNGHLLAASPGVTLPITAINTKAARDFFVLQPDDDQPPFYGLSVRTAYGDEPVWVQVAFHPGNIVYDSVLEEFVQDIAWIWIPFVAILLLVNLLVARIGLAPLRMAANQAAAIGPGAASMRLTETELPARRARACRRGEVGTGQAGNGLRRAEAIHRRCRARAPHARHRAQGACGHPPKIRRPRATRR